MVGELVIRMNASAKIFMVISFLGAATVSAQESSDFDIDDFIASTCLDCHDDLVQEGDRNFEDLFFPIDSIESAIRWKEVLDVMNLGEMPPKKNGRATVSDRDLQEAINFLTDSLARVTASLSDERPETTARLLSKAELQYVFQDLFSLHGQEAEVFPTLRTRKPDHGLFKIGSSAKPNPDWFREAFGDIAGFVDRSLELKLEQPVPEERTFSGRDFRPRTNVFVNHEDEYAILRGRYVTQSHALLKTFQGGVSHAGFYDIEFDAAALYRENEFPDWLMRPMIRDEPFLLQVGIDRYDPSPNGNVMVFPRRAAIAEIADWEPMTYKLRLWLEKGEVPTFLFLNGPRHNTVYNSPYHARTFAPQALLDSMRAHDATLKRVPTTPAREVFAQEDYPFPGIKISRVSINGPLFDDYPPVQHKRLFGSLLRLTESERTYERLHTHAFILASRIWRRTVSKAEVDGIADRALSRYREHGDWQSAVRTLVLQVVASPNSLFSIEKPKEAGQQLDDLELATRLAFFIWNSAPDYELRGSRLSVASDRHGQIERMLSDRRGSRFAEEFVNQWLQLYKLGTMPPDAVKFERYVDERLQDDTKKETILLFQEALEKNLTMEEMLDARHTWVNLPLAIHYDLPTADLKRTEFSRVEVPQSHPNRGLLGHSSILTLTSNGVDTSPVIRGVYLLENILGTPPPPAPPDVPVIEPDIRGATTIRDQLEKHRQIKSCASCHARFDPLGLSMESLDAVGVFRETYPNKAPIENTAHLRGHKLDGMAGLRQYLVDNTDLAERHLLETMLRFAAGRNLTVLDENEIVATLDRWCAAGGGIRDLVFAVTDSQIFRNK